MRYSLRTLLVLLIVMPPLAAEVWREVVKWRARWQEDQWIDVGGPGTISPFTTIRCGLGSFDPEELTADMPKDAVSSATIEGTEEP